VTAPRGDREGRVDTQEKFSEYMLAVASRGVQPLAVREARGCTLVGEDGREYLDCFAGISVVNAGHNHPKIQEAAKRQIDALVHCGSYVYPSAPVADLAEKLAEITPAKLKKSFVANSGAEAVEGALRLAKQATGQREIIALGFSFHGRTVGTLSITGNCIRKKHNGPYLSGVAFAPTPYCYRCPFKLEYPRCGCACAEAMELTLHQQTSDDVAAFIAEPILGEGGIIVPPEEYFKIAVEIVRARGALFICDEVQSGFGRTGKMFAIEHYGVAPEIMTMAKGIANGYPLSAFTVADSLGDVMQPGDHLSTFGGNPVSCAAALANIDVLQDEGLVENSAERGGQLLDGLRELQEKQPLIGDVRGKGLMIGIELVKDRATKAPAADAAKAARNKLRERGILIGAGGAYGNVLRLQPPLCISAEACARVADEVAAALDEIKAP
jgi:4-aminobutyrate aminotransferase